ncbi:MAG: DNA helicase RecG, partial [Patescibacteria group bacterium]
AQLHQLRGRIGRSNSQGYCYLSQSSNNPPSRRLRAIETMSDGFKLSELDLEIRGPGAIYGTRQSGALDLSLANITDQALVADVSAAVKSFIESDTQLVEYDLLQAQVERLQKVTNLN